MLGTDLTKADDDFRITCFWMENGEPKFEFSHSADGSGNSLVPRIKPLGKAKPRKACRHRFRFSQNLPTWGLLPTLS